MIKCSFIILRWLFRVNAFFTDVSSVLMLLARRVVQHSWISSHLSPALPIRWKPTNWHFFLMFWNGYKVLQMKTFENENVLVRLMSSKMQSWLLSLVANCKYVADHDVALLGLFPLGLFSLLMFNRTITEQQRWSWVIIPLVWPVVWYALQVTFV